MMLGIRKGFAINLYGEYLFTKTDFCPFIGGAFGFHWITHDDFDNSYYVSDVYVERKDNGDCFYDWDFVKNI